MVQGGRSTNDAALKSDQHTRRGSPLGPAARIVVSEPVFPVKCSSPLDSFGGSTVTSRQNNCAESRRRTPVQPKAYTAALTTTNVTTNTVTIQPNMLRCSSNAIIPAITAIAMLAIKIATAPPPCGTRSDHLDIDEAALTAVNLRRATETPK
jgi:hypothetical protein